MKLVLKKDLRKYILLEDWEHKLHFRYNILCEFDNGYHYLKKKEDGWYIGAYAGCRVDGATNWFDTKFILKGSVGHDILHWLIRDGIISTADNYKIDAELELIVLESNKNYPWWKGGTIVKHIRARAIRRGTNLVYQKLGEKEEIITIP